MARVKRGVTARAYHKKILKKAKGYYGGHSRVFRSAVQAVTKAGQYAFRDRRVKKREFRALWMQRINAGAREHGLSYSRFIRGHDAGRRDPGSQNPRGHGDARQARLCRAGCPGQSQAGGLSPFTMFQRGEGASLLPFLLCQSERMSESIDTLLQQAQAQISAATDLRALEQLRVDWLGKKGRITELLKTLGAWPAEQRKTYGERSIAPRTQASQWLDARKTAAGGCRTRRQAAPTSGSTSPCRAAEKAAAACIRITRMIERIERLVRRARFRNGGGARNRG